MSTIIQYADGLQFEVPEEMQGEVRVADTGQIVLKVSRTFDEVLEHQVKPAAQKLVAILRDVSPKEIEVEFGVKITGEAGEVFTKAGVEGQFTIKLKWDRSPDK